MPKHLIDTRVSQPGGFAGLRVVRGCGRLPAHALVAAARRMITTPAVRRRSDATAEKPRRQIEAKMRPQPVEAGSGAASEPLPDGGSDRQNSPIDGRGDRDFRGARAGNRVLAGGFARAAGTDGEAGSQTQRRGSRPGCCWPGLAPHAVCCRRSRAQTDLAQKVAQLETDLRQLPAKPGAAAEKFRSVCFQRRPPVARRAHLWWADGPFAGPLPRTHSPALQRRRQIERSARRRIFAGLGRPQLADFHQPDVESI